MRGLHPNEYTFLVLSEPYGDECGEHMNRLSPQTNNWELAARLVQRGLAYWYLGPMHCQHFRLTTQGRLMLRIHRALSYFG